MLTPIGTYNGVAVCKCVENCDFKASWEAAGKPTHFDSEMVLNRDYMPSEGELSLFKFLRTKYCLNR